MPLADYTREDIGKRAHEIYDSRIRAEVEPEHIGEFLTVDIESGDYALGSKILAAVDALRARRPEGVFFTFRVGYPAAVSFRGQMRLGRG